MITVLERPIILPDDSYVASNQLCVYLLSTDEIPIDANLYLEVNLFRLDTSEDILQSPAIYRPNSLGEYYVNLSGILRSFFVNRQTLDYSQSIETIDDQLIPFRLTWSEYRGNTLLSSGDEGSNVVDAVQASKQVGEGEVATMVEYRPQNPAVADFLTKFTNPVAWKGWPRAAGFLHPAAMIDSKFIEQKYDQSGNLIIQEQRDIPNLSNNEMSYAMLSNFLTNEVRRIVWIDGEIAVLAMLQAVSTPTLANCNTTFFVNFVFQGNGLSPYQFRVETQAGAVFSDWQNTPNSGLDTDFDFNMNGNEGDFRVRVRDSRLLESTNLNFNNIDFDTGTPVIDSVTIDFQEWRTELCGTRSILGLEGSGGQPDYEYRVNGGDWVPFSIVAKQTITIDATGDFTFEVRDSCGTISAPVTRTLNPVAAPVPVANIGNFVFNAVGCTKQWEATTGASGGSGGPYEIQIDGGAWIPLSGSYFAAAPGSYDFKVRDQCNTESVIVTKTAVDQALESPVISNVQSSFSTDCDRDWLITYNQSGGIGPYEVSLNGSPFVLSTGTVQTSQEGNNTIIVRDSCLSVSSPAVIDVGNQTVPEVNITSVSVADLGGDLWEVTINFTPGLNNHLWDVFAVAIIENSVIDNSSPHVVQIPGVTGVTEVNIIVTDGCANQDFETVFIGEAPAPVDPYPFLIQDFVKGGAFVTGNDCDIFNYDISPLNFFADNSTLGNGVRLSTSQTVDSPPPDGWYAWLGDPAGLEVFSSFQLINGFISSYNECP